MFHNLFRFLDLRVIYKYKLFLIFPEDSFDPIKFKLSDSEILKFLLLLGNKVVLKELIKYHELKNINNLKFLIRGLADNKTVKYYIKEVYNDNLPFPEEIVSELVLSNREKLAFYYNFDFRSIFRSEIVFNKFLTVKKILEEKKYPPTFTDFFLALMNSDLATISILKSKEFINSLTQRDVYLICSKERFEVIEYLYKEGLKPVEELIDILIIKKQIKLLRYHKKSLSEKLMNLVLNTGSLKLIKFFSSHNSFKVNYKHITRISELKKFKTFKYLLDSGLVKPEEKIFFAAVKDINCFEYLVKKYLKFFPRNFFLEFLASIFFPGLIQCEEISSFLIQFPEIQKENYLNLVTQVVEGHSNLLNLAIKYECLELLKFLVEKKNFEVNTSHLEYALCFNRKPLVTKYLLNKFQLTEREFFMAIEKTKDIELLLNYFDIGTLRSLKDSFLVVLSRTKNLLKLAKLIAEQNKHLITPDFISAVIVSEDQASIEFLLENFRGLFNFKALLGATSNPKLFKRLLELLSSKLSQKDFESLLDYILILDSVELLSTTLVLKDYQLKLEFLLNAIKQRKNKIALWILNNYPCLLGDSLADFAAAVANRKVLKFLKSRGATVTKEGLRLAKGKCIPLCFDQEELPELDMLLENENYEAIIYLWRKYGKKVLNSIQPEKIFSKLRSTFYLLEIAEKIFEF
jgi:hypothetical protein